MCSREQRKAGTHTHATIHTATHTATERVVCIMGIGSKHQKGPRAKAREIRKGAKQGPKVIGTTKPPSGEKALYGVTNRHGLGGKKAKKAAATAAAYALLESAAGKGPKKKPKFSY